MFTSLSTLYSSSYYLGHCLCQRFRSELEVEVRIDKNVATESSPPACYAHIRTSLLQDVLRHTSD
jgi:hypothetical protein